MLKGMESGLWDFKTCKQARHFAFAVHKSIYSNSKNGSIAGPRDQ
jgi:hypothetical protein